MDGCIIIHRVAIATTSSRLHSSLVPILRSGLGMVEALQTVLPEPVPIHHLGLFREPVTLQPVEYYNNLPNHTEPPNPNEEHVAIIVDPIIATGGTAVAAIQTLREWGVKKIVFLCVLGSESGVRRAAEEWTEGAEIWVGAVDKDVDGKGYLKPGCGDVGDRLFSTKGK